MSDRWLDYSGCRPSWAYPACPFCVTDVLVEDEAGRDGGYYCWGCGERFTRHS